MKTKLPLSREYVEFVTELKQPHPRRDCTPRGR